MLRHRNWVMLGSILLYLATRQFAFIGHFVLTQTSDGGVAQLLVGTAGIAIMTAVAYYGSWSKRVEKSAHGHTAPPSGDKSSVAPGDLARPAERAAIGAV